MTREDAIKTLKELRRETNDSWYEEVYNMAINALEADCKTEPSNSEKPNNCETCRHWWKSEDVCLLDDCHYEPRDEPQTVSLTSAHISGDVYHKVEDEPQMERPCDTCQEWGCYGCGYK